MGLIVKHFEEEFDFYIKNRIKIVHLGDKNGINKSVLNAISNVERETANFDSLVVYLAFNYSGKYDIIQAVNKIIEKMVLDKEQGENRDRDIKDIDEDTFSKYLLTSDIKNPDLIIRTSGEFRISNYFLWQAAYSEFSIIDKLWPDIQKEDIINAIEDFCDRERRYGGTKK
jgi:undecaprenyl diphosphate synthase